MQRVYWNNLHNVALSRHPSYQHLYNQQKELTLRIYHAYSDYIKIKYMNFDTKTKSHKICSVKKHDSLDIVFIENMYPYHLAKNIHHYIIWSLKPLSKIQVDTYLATFNITKYKTLINDTSRCSVPDLWHCHVFWK
jgi:hypothetical protein